MKLTTEWLIAGGAMAFMGLALLVSAERKRNVHSFDVPLLSRTTKAFTGGTLLLVSLLMTAMLYLKS
jgi:hypothetical protein